MPRKYKWKVVKRKTRMSAIVNGNSKYAKKYIKGQQVFANENTLGIMVFETKKEADNWVFSICVDLLKTLKVVPIGRGKRIHFIANNTTTDILDYFYQGDNYISVFREIPPDGTVAYPGVLVVD